MKNRLFLFIVSSLFAIGIVDAKTQMIKYGKINHSLFILIFTILICSSCSYTPEERVEKVVKDYISAIQDGNYSKESSLAYEDVVIEDSVAIYGEDTEEPLTSNLDITVKKQCAITKDDKFVIKRINKIYGTSLQQEGETVAVETVAVETAVAEVEVEETPHVAESSAPNSTISWPSDVNAAYNVEVTSGNKNITFTVVQINKKDYKIYSTKGLYLYDFNDFTAQTGCTVSIAEASDDNVMEQNVLRFIDNLKTFDIFSKAIASNDTSKIIRIFPALKDFNYSLIGKPSAKSYIQDGNNSCITINDSLAFVFSSAGTIADSYGVISTKEAEDAVKALGETPYARNELSDIQYINKLNNQVFSIEREKERKAKAAKYISQGVALISSRLSNGSDGAKGVSFSALNTSNKTAKYIIMEVVGYNSVDDPVWSDGYLKRCRGIGPIAPGEGGSWDFNDIWENGSIVDSYEIKKLIIQFSDGTSKSVRLPQSLPSDWRDWLY